MIRYQPAEKSVKDKKLKPVTRPKAKNPPYSKSDIVANRPGGYKTR